MRGIEFYRDSEGYIEFRSEPRLKCFGMWLTDDIHGVHYTCLDLLADLEDVAAGRKESESWEGNAWAAEITAEGVHLQNLWRDALKAHYPLPEARKIVQQYWRLLAEDPARDRAIAEWEADNERPHPYPGL